MNTMIGKAPRGHTSIYFCDFIRNNWDGWGKYIVARGHNSVNRHVNVLLVDDYRANYSQVMRGIFKKNQEKWDFYQPIPKNIRELTNTMSDGQIVDLTKMISEWRTLFITELKRRGVRV